MLHAEGPLLAVDLSSRMSETESIDDVFPSFIGGRGVASS